jgi:hypothetical protein
MTTVCIFAPSLGHELETIGYFFRSSGVEVIFATRPTGDDRSEHPWSLKRVFEQKHKVRWVSDEPEKVDLLIAEAFVDPQYIGKRNIWISHSKEAAFIFPHVGMTVKRRVAHLLKSWPCSVTVRTAIFYGDRRDSCDAWSPTLQRRTFFSPYLHPQLFSDEPLNQVFSDFSVNEPRPYAIGFMGNMNPKERSTILAECRRAIEGAKARSFWIEYGDNEHQNALTPEQFISTLGQMDFCLCPTGWSRWTHRVVESLCRGAIPILQDAHLYGLGLQDSVNCIMVRGNDWYGSVKAALSLPIEDLHNLRRNVFDLRKKMLIPSVAAQRFSGQFKYL